MYFIVSFLTSIVETFAVTTFYLDPWAQMEKKPLPSLVDSFCFFSLSLIINPKMP